MLTSVNYTFSYSKWQGSSLKPYEWNFPKSSTITMTVRTRNYTDTVKRVYPLDGYQLATNRTTVTDLYNKAIIDWCDSPYGSKYTNYPFWYMYPRSTSRYTSTGAVLSDPVTTLDRNAMYNHIRKNLRNEATNLANMLGEYRETAETFLDLAQVVVTRGKSLLKYRPKGRSGRRSISAVQTWASNHLAFQYGIAPLANDMGTAIGELRSAITAAPPFKEGVVTRRDRVSNIGFRATNSTVYTRKASSEVIKDTRYRSQWRAYMNQNALLVCLAEHGMLNPASLAWELMPFSFVIDWWVGVGDMLSSLDNLLICDKLMSMDSSSVKTFEYARTALDDRTFVCQQGFYAGRTDTRRTPVEIPRVSGLSYKPSLSYGHFFNGMALLAVAAKRL